MPPSVFPYKRPFFNCSLTQSEIDVRSAAHVGRCSCAADLETRSTGSSRAPARRDFLRGRVPRVLVRATLSYARVHAPMELLAFVDELDRSRLDTHALRRPFRRHPRGPARQPPSPLLASARSRPGVRGGSRRALFVVSTLFLFSCIAFAQEDLAVLITHTKRRRKTSPNAAREGQ